MYNALVRSRLDYCDILYHILSVQDQLGGILNSLMEKAERILYQTALAITGTSQGSNRSKLYDESLSERRWCRRVLQIHKIVNYAPYYLKWKFCRYCRPLHAVKVLLVGTKNKRLNLQFSLLMSVCLRLFTF